MFNLAARTNAIRVISTIRPDLTIREVGELAFIWQDLDTYRLIATIQPTWTVRQVGTKAKELGDL